MIDREQIRLNAFNRNRKRLGEDLCDVVKMNFSDGGGAGDTLTANTEGADIPCFYESTGSRSQIIVGGTAYLASHRIQMEKSASSLAITPRDKIKIQARGGKAEMIFERPVIVEGAFTPLVTVMATLVQQGYME